MPVRGKRRKYYRGTPSGRKVLDEARQKLLELVAEVIEDHDQPFQIIRQKRLQRDQTRRRSTDGD